MRIEVLINKKISLGKQKGDAKRREDIQARIVDIAEETDDIQQLLAVVDFTLKAAAAGATTAV